MACPKGGRVLIPAGNYRIKSLFLKSNINIELAEGAVLLARHDRAALAYIPGTVAGDEGAGNAMLPLGRWEGESFSTYCSTFTGLSVHDVCIYGRGAIDGQTDFAEDNWWNKDFKNIFRPEEGREIARPRMIFLSECENVSLAGFTVRNSPAWTVHPLNCVDVLIEDVSICNPYNSPNTDGINPESCRDVRILNCRVDVGDDCITLKSGTEETPSPVPCENIVIANCLLVHGHGGIVIGSEMSGGVRNVTVTNCVFTGTDRGLRVKTRRRRGGCVENLRLSNLVMERVFCPFVFNMYYSCGTAEKDRWVWEKTPYPVDGGTPAFRNIRINGVTVVGATASAGFFYGLAESPIDGLSLTDCHIEMARGAAPEKPAMMGNLEPMSARGFFLRNAKNVEFHNVTLKNADGEAYDTDESVDGEF
mgnify:CR=1 FL=1